MVLKNLHVLHGITSSRMNIHKLTTETFNCQREHVRQITQYRYAAVYKYVVPFLLQSKVISIICHIIYGYIKRKIFFESGSIPGDIMYFSWPEYRSGFPWPSSKMATASQSKWQPWYSQVVSKLRTNLAWPCLAWELRQSHPGVPSTEPSFHLLAVYDLTWKTKPNVDAQAFTTQGCFFLEIPLKLYSCFPYAFYGKFDYESMDQSSCFSWNPGASAVKEPVFYI